MESCDRPRFQTEPVTRDLLLEAVLGSEHNAVGIVVGAVNPLGVPVAQLNTHHHVFDGSPLVVHQNVAVGFGFTANIHAIGCSIVPVNLGHAYNCVNAAALVQVEAEAHAAAIARNVFQVAISIQIGVICKRGVQILVGAICVVCRGMEIDAFTQTQSNAREAGVGNCRIVSRPIVMSVLLGQGSYGKCAAVELGFVPGGQHRRAVFGNQAVGGIQVTFRVLDRHREVASGVTQLRLTVLKSCGAGRTTEVECGQAANEAGVVGPGLTGQYAIVFTV